MALDTSDWLARIAALYIEAFESIGIRADAKPYFWHWQEGYPYVVLQLGEITLDNGQVLDVDDGDGEDFDRYTVTITGYLYAAKVDDNYRGITDADLAEWIGVIISYFNDRELLQSNTYPDAADDITFARITACTGVGIQGTPSAGNQTNALGAQFTHTIEATYQVDQAYN